MQLNYTKKVMRYFMHPKNVGKIDNADGIGKVGNIQCGDVMYIYIKIGKKDKKEYIKDIKFQTLGCPAAVATSSVITELAKGKTIEEAMKITNKDIIKVIGELPPIKYHCSLLAEQALNEAIYNYFKKQKRKIPKSLEKKHKQMLELEKKFEEKFKK
ncbi:MAG: iron-sulfur cluster assembly scaffold protein [Candidatus Pacearchaeota archaeon]|nr:iron-sulfur cluster assembly scaffold protein [Candidatus Pacearchaeota archaeon]